LAGIYVVAGGVVGTAQALLDLHAAGKVRLVCNDIVPQMTELIRQSVIDATILQDPATQGQLPIKLLYQMIAERIAPDKEFYYTKMDIITKNML
jgi:LacI family transcriptional regulator